MQEADNEKVTLQTDASAAAETLRRYGVVEVDVDEPYVGIMRLAAQICDAPMAAIAVNTPDRQWLKAAVGFTPASGAPSEYPAHTLASAESDDVDVIEDVTAVPRLASDSWTTGETCVRFYAGVPIPTPAAGDDPIAILFVADRKPRKLSAQAVSTLRDLACQLAMTIENRVRLVDLEQTVNRQRKEEEDLKAQVEQIHSYSRELQVHAVRLEAINARLEALAKLDGMTGLKNHRAFQERLEFEFQRAMRYSMPLSLLLLDVDSFKQFNDTFGHLAGDEVLKTVAQVLQDNARGVDFVARYGGEEFVVILPHADEAASMAIGERLRAAIENVVWPLRSVTASFGISTLSQAMTHASDLIALADKALYGSKTAGRNRVTHCVDMGNDAK